MRADTIRTKVDDRCYLIECLYCGETFEATRADATYCSARCRVAASREPQRLENAIKALESYAISARQISQRYYRSPRVAEAMRRLHKEIEATLWNFETE